MTPIENAEALIERMRANERGERTDVTFAEVCNALDDLVPMVKAQAERISIRQQLIERQSMLLQGVVTAVRGPAPELVVWSNHDAVELVQGVIARAERAEAALTEIRASAVELLDADDDSYDGSLSATWVVGVVDTALAPEPHPWSILDFARAAGVTVFEIAPEPPADDEIGRETGADDPYGHLPAAVDCRECSEEKHGACNGETIVEMESGEMATVPCSCAALGHPAIFTVGA